MNPQSHQKRNTRPHSAGQNQRSEEKVRKREVDDKSSPKFALPKGGFKGVYRVMFLTGAYYSTTKKQSPGPRALWTLRPLGASSVAWLTMGFKSKSSCGRLTQSNYTTQTGRSRLTRAHHHWSTESCKPSIKLLMPIQRVAVCCSPGLTQ